MPKAAGRRNPPKLGIQHKFAEKMRAARTQAGLSQANLQKRLKDEYAIKLDTSGITRIEAGQREPRLNEALSIAAILGFHLDDPASAARDLKRQLNDLGDHIASSRESLHALLRRVDRIIDFVRENPKSVGDRNLETLVREQLERFRGEKPAAGENPATKAEGAEEFKGQVFRVATAIGDRER